MIHYSRIIMAAVGELWAIEETKLREITAFLMLKADGGMVASEDLARITKKTERETASSSGDIAILPVMGTISARMNMMDDFSGGTSTSQLAGAFRAAVNDPSVKAIIFDHDSPGGTVAGTGELAEEIRLSRGQKPIIAQVNNLMASASYWLGSAADEIVVTPGGEAGALGVYRIHEDVSAMLEQRGIKPTFITSDGSPFKVEDADTAPLTEEAFQHHKARVNQQFDRFVRAVAAGRGRSLTDVRENFGKGRMFGADELVARGMADRIGTLEDTIERLGGGEFNPIANANRQRAQARAQETEIASQAAVDLVKKLKAGGQPSRREIEHGFKGLAAVVGETLSNSEAEAAVMLLQKSSRGGRAKAQTASTVIDAERAAARAKVEDALKILTRRA